MKEPNVDDGTGGQRDHPPLRCVQVLKEFREGGQALRVLDGVDLEIAAGERIAIVGPSGAGKTTLLQILGGLDDPLSGRVEVFGRELASLSAAERGRLRNRVLGFVYQFHHLLPEFTALENVAMPLLIRRLPLAEVERRAGDLLEKVGLGERLSHRPGELSGGERQRVAMARALVTEPAVVLADEPTGNLDKRTGQRVLELLLELNAEAGSSLVIVTHDEEIAARMQRVLRLEEGRLQDVTAEYHAAAAGGS
ncbi:MAG: lipoprotein-releasing ABC transporter ATP-binding protein LolD [Chromatiales bacterium]|nr:lipoprotein-releasing ABC transporter ATP-binding protein LolD [Chromatiales bacterium]